MGTRNASGREVLPPEDARCPALRFRLLRSRAGPCLTPGPPAPAPAVQVACAKGHARGLGEEPRPLESADGNVGVECRFTRTVTKVLPVVKVPLIAIVLNAKTFLAKGLVSHHRVFRMGPWTLQAGIRAERMSSVLKERLHYSDFRSALKRLAESRQDLEVTKQRWALSQCIFILFHFAAWSKPLFSRAPVVAVTLLCETAERRRSRGSFVTLITPLTPAAGTVSALAGRQVHRLQWERLDSSNRFCKKYQVTIFS